MNKSHKTRVIGTLKWPVQPYPEYICSEELVQLEGDDFDDGHDDELEGARLAEHGPERDEDRRGSEVSSQQAGTTTTTQLLR